MDRVLQGLEHRRQDRFLAKDRGDGLRPVPLPTVQEPGDHRKVSGVVTQDAKVEALRSLLPALVAGQGFEVRLVLEVQEVGSGGEGLARAVQIALERAGDRLLSRARRGRGRTRRDESN